jgi:hypothetical protein
MRTSGPGDDPLTNPTPDLVIHDWVCVPEVTLRIRSGTKLASCSVGEADAMENRTNETTLKPQNKRKELHSHPKAVLCVDVGSIIVERGA